MGFPPPASPVFLVQCGSAWLSSPREFRERYREFSHDATQVIHSSTEVCVGLLDGIGNLMTHLGPKVRERLCEGAVHLFQVLLTLRFGNA